MRRRASAPIFLVAAGVWALAGWAATARAAGSPLAQGVPPPPPGEFRPPPPPPQPIAYSHKQHLAQGFDCVFCHATARTDAHATLPPTATCMACHTAIKTDSPEIQKLKDFDARKEDVPWKRVYRLADYVYFSHETHAAADPAITCDTCHGNVRDMEMMQKVKDTSMAACMDCHKQRSAPILCDSCHEKRG